MRTLVAALLSIPLATVAVAKEAPLKPGKVHHLTSPKHGRPYSLFVPSKYSKKSSWPMVFSSHGRGGRGKKEMNAWQGLANSYGFIVACPDMVTATHDLKTSSSLSPSKEDDEVLLSIFEFVSSRFRVNRRAVMITGFSGGGNPSYHSGLRHPEVFTHICTRGGNFAPQQIPPDAKVRAAGREHLQIYIFFGENDHVLIIGDQGNNGQAHAARDALKNAGYENVEFECVPGMGHQSRPRKAAEWFGAYLAKNKKLFKAGDKADGMMEKARQAIAKGKTKDAITQLVKCEKHERKYGLKPAARAELEALEEAGQAKLAEAEALRAGGDAKGAKKLAEAVKRDYRGLPVEKAAKELLSRWKQEDKGD
jgi:predicted esterase